MTILSPILDLSLVVIIGLLITPVGWALIASILRGMWRRSNIERKPSERKLRHAIMGTNARKRLVP